MSRFHNGSVESLVTLGSVGAAQYGLFHSFAQGDYLIYLLIAGTAAG